MSGSVTITAPGLTRQVPFRLEASRRYLAELTLERRSRLEPAE